MPIGVGGMEMIHVEDDEDGDEWERGEMKYLLTHLYDYLGGDVCVHGIWRL